MSVAGVITIDSDVECVDLVSSSGDESDGEAPALVFRRYQAPNRRKQAVAETAAPAEAADVVEDAAPAVAETAAPAEAADVVEDAVPAVAEDPAPAVVAAYRWGIDDEDHPLREAAGAAFMEELRILFSMTLEERARASDERSIQSWLAEKAEKKERRAANAAKAAAAALVPRAAGRKRLLRRSASPEMDRAVDTLTTETPMGNSKKLRKFLLEESSEEEEDVEQKKQDRIRRRKKKEAYDLECRQDKEVKAAAGRFEQDKAVAVRANLAALVEEVKRGEIEDLEAQEAAAECTRNFPQGFWGLSDDE